MSSSGHAPPSSASGLLHLLSGGSMSGKKTQWDSLRSVALIAALIRRTPARSLSWLVIGAFVIRRLFIFLGPQQVKRLVDAARARLYAFRYLQSVQENAISFSELEAYQVKPVLRRRSSRSSLSLPAINEQHQYDGDDEAAEEQEEEEMKAAGADAVTASLPAQ